MADENKPNAVKNFVAGTVGGIAQVLSGQPFDTIKVRLQSMPTPAPGQSPMYNGVVDCLKQTLKQEGFMALYKGTLAPLAGVGLCVAIQFAAVEQGKKFLRKDEKTPLTWGQLYLAGAMAGVANSVVSGPVEHIRTRLQVQTGSTAAGSVRYNGTIDAVRKIFASHGLAGIYKGQVITILREFQGYGGYFLGYEFAVRQCLEEGQRVQDLNPLIVMGCGAAGGFAMWLPVYPVDSIKSKLQTDAFGENRKYKGILDCIAKTWKVEGIAGFYRGFVPCLLRAAPVNAATFLAFELSMRVLGRD